MIDKIQLKQSLTIEQVFTLVSELGGEPQMRGEYFISHTICHNPAGQGSYKLYYFDNTKLFKCFTDCGETFDIFDLVRKQKAINDGLEWTLFNAVLYVAAYFGYEDYEPDYGNQEKLKDWEKLSAYERLNETRGNPIVELKTYDQSVLKHLPRPIIEPWEKEGISRDIMRKRGIAYDPVNEGIVIPHFSISGDLIGIRERTLIREQEAWGKYRPAKIHGKLYNHPLSFNLYNLNNSKEAIKIIKKAVVMESEKSCLLYSSLIGEENDISVACCGSSLIFYQVMLLLSLGVEEIIVAFDKQFQEIGDEEFKRWTKKLTDIHNKYSPYAKISFIFDKWDILGYKDAPLDRGADIFLELFNRRIEL